MVPSGHMSVLLTTEILFISNTLVSYTIISRDDDFCILEECNGGGNFIILNGPNISTTPSAGLVMQK